MTTTTQFDQKDNKLKPKFAVKLTHPSGFTLKKLELTQDCKVSLESSLAGVAPGLELEFKGNDSDKGDLCVTYKVPVATITADFDFNNFSYAKASVNGGHGPFTIGGSANLKIAKSSLDSASFEFGAGYSVPKLLFCGVRAADNFSKFSANFAYNAMPDVKLAGLVNYSPKGASATLASMYQVAPATTLKVKAATTGVFSASVKQAFEKKFAVVGSAEVPSSLNSVKFGVNATLG